MTQWVIYKHTSERSGKSYVGLTKRSMELRWKEHCRDASMGSDKHFHRAIRLYGEDNWKHEVIIEGIDTVEEANALEKFYIKQCDTFENGYNLTLGGDGALFNDDEFTFYNKELNTTETCTVHELSMKYELHPGYVRYVAKGERDHCRGWFIWVGDEGNYDTDPVYKFEHKDYGVEELTLKGMVDKYNLSKGNLHSVTTGKRNHTKGWTLVGNQAVLTERKVAHNAIEVEKYDMDGNTVCTYPSILQAAEDNGVGEHIVRDRCTGRAEGMYNYQGYRFKNKKEGSK